MKSITISLQLKKFGSLQSEMNYMTTNTDCFIALSTNMHTDSYKILNRNYYFGKHEYQEFDK